MTDGWSRGARIRLDDAPSQCLVASDRSTRVEIKIANKMAARLQLKAIRKDSSHVSQLESSCSNRATPYQPSNSRCARSTSGSVRSVSLKKQPRVARTVYCSEHRRARNAGRSRCPVRNTGLPCPRRRRALVPIMTTAQIELLGFEVLRPATDPRRQRNAQPLCNRTCNLVLNLEYVLQLPIVALGPELEAAQGRPFTVDFAIDLPGSARRSP
jgi:hypothetical protein